MRKELLLLNVHFLDKFTLILKQLRESLEKSEENKVIQREMELQDSRYERFYRKLTFNTTDRAQIFIYCSPLKTEKNSKGITYHVEVAYFMVSLKWQKEKRRELDVMREMMRI